MSFLPFVRLWLWVSVLATTAGWTLSALGQLNQAGYAVCLVFAVVLFWLQRKGFGFSPGNRTSRWRKLFRRLLRPLPLCFAALTLLIFLGGVLYAPTSYTGLSYRVPRVLQWLSHEHWTWIHTPNFRMNDRACGIEWLSAPLLLFTKSTRGLFLINFLPFLLMPGLIFSIFTRLGVRSRVAWQWMWLLPTGYNFLLQAGSIANDTFPTVYALAAIDFGLRAWQTRRTSDVWYSILAAALLTGAKASNLPLLLPWAIVIFPTLPLLLRRRWERGVHAASTSANQKGMKFSSAQDFGTRSGLKAALPPVAVTVLVIFLAAAVSFLPTAILNTHYIGDWSGLSIEREGMNMKSPIIGVWGNALLLTFNNFVPPLFPMAGWWNQHALTVLPQSIAAPMVANFEPSFHIIGELPTEDWAGIGFGLSALLLISFVASRFTRQASVSVSAFPRFPLYALVLLAPWIALLAYCMKSGMVTPQRLIAPYYPLLVPLLLVGAGQSQIIRRLWWRVMVGLALALAFVVLVLSPDRPLWPAKTILSKLHELHPDQRLITRALKVYTVYSQRGDPLANVRALLPLDAKTIGFIGTEDDADISLWQPIGERSVEHFSLTDPPELIRQKKVRYIVVGGFNLKYRSTTLDDWLKFSGAELVGQTTATLKVSEGEQPWYVVRFKD